MKKLSKVLAAAFCMLLMTCSSYLATANPIGPDPAKYTFDQHGEFSDPMNVLLESVSKQKAELVPIPFSNNSSSLFSGEFNRNHFLLISIILSLTLLVISHKNHFESDIYEFYHRGSNGSITFESMEAQRAHYMRLALAKILRIGGIVLGLSAVVSMIFG